MKVLNSFLHFFKYFLKKTFQETKKHALWLLAFLFPVIFTRIYLLLKLSEEVKISDIQGFSSDIGVSLLFFLLALLLPWGRKGFAGILLLFQGFYLCGNSEHIITLGSSFDFFYLKYLKNDTFLKGSTAHSFNYFLSFFVLLLPLICLFLSKKTSFPKFLFPTSFFLSTFLLALTSLGRPSLHLPVWRQFNPLHENTLNIFKRVDAEVVQRKKDFSQFNYTFTPPKKIDLTYEKELEDLFKKDLEGTPRIKLDNKNHNVLLIMIESLSTPYVESVSGKPYRDKIISMDYLSTLAKESLRYQNFISHNRQTNRGEYAFLCGDYPNHVNKSAKMDLYTDGDLETHSCLPEVLKNNGYKTVYLQAAPLSFMSKDRFMKKIGYEEVYGESWFESAYKWSSWGPDDKAFFEQSQSFIKNLEKQKKPWFLTLLTVGTHHPFKVGKHFKSKHKSQTIENSFAYLDQSLKPFMEKLASGGILDDTLVIITSDEAHGYLKLKGIRQLISENWIPMIIIPPKNKNTEKFKTIKDPYMQTDLALSITDYLGIKSDNLEFYGQSLFRKYDKKRLVVFANTYQKKVGISFGLEEFLLCEIPLQNCSQFSSKEKVVSPFDFKERDFLNLKNPLQRFLSLNEKTTKTRETAYQSYTLTSRGPKIIASSRFDKLYAYQYLFIPPERSINIRLKFSVDEGEIVFYQKISTNYGKKTLHKMDPIKLKAGENMTAYFEFFSLEKMNALEAILRVKNLSPKAKVTITEAEMTIKSALGSHSHLVSQSLKVGEVQL